MNQGAREGSKRVSQGEWHTDYVLRFFCPGGGRPQTEVMVEFIDQHKNGHGVESICRRLPIAPATDDEQKAREQDSTRLPARAVRGGRLRPEVQRIWDEKFPVYGVRRVWRQLNREDICVARCTFERIMRSLGLRVVVRGKKTRTTVADDELTRPADQVTGQFDSNRPNPL